MVAPLLLLLLLSLLAPGLHAAQRAVSDPFDPEAKAWEGAEERTPSFDELMAVLRRQQGVPEVDQLIATLEELHQVYLAVDKTEASLDPDTFRSIPEIVRYKGYPAESHHVVTRDGYVIEIFRIPHGLNTTRGGVPVLLSHGLIDTAGTWVLNYPHESLSYLLADAGYDVWMGNVRGNRYGEGHLEHGRYDRKLWDFSFDEQAKYDIVDTLDYIRNATSRERVAVVGHSQGCTQLFAAFHLVPEISSKISFFAALAPAVYFEHNRNTLVQLAAGFYIAELLELFGLNKFIPLPTWLEETIPYVCDLAPTTVEFLLGLIMGYNPGETNKARMSVLCYHSLGMTSVQNMVHWAQMVRTKEFKAHDFGWFSNPSHYGSRSPPHFNPSKSFPPALPIAVFYGGKDLLVSPEDTRDMIADLPVDPVFEALIPDYAHMDFVHGQSARANVYEDVLRLMAQYAR